VYSIDSGTSLKWNDLLKGWGVNPFFGTKISHLIEVKDKLSNTSNLQDFTSITCHLNTPLWTQFRPKTIASGNRSGMGVYTHLPL
jgi:hypothetical protein